MRISPLDVHQKEFGHAMRGYREDEVDSFLDAVAAELERLGAESVQLQERVASAESKSLNFEAERNTIHNALLTAQRASDDVLAKAEARSQELVAAAERKADGIVHDALAEKNAATEEIRRLR
ncbi:MAG: DivIVA domain-containing protein, partial [Actinomycetes bacterium]|nr:DivIVA domain-containing protein [Actinomycetes bacterium]